MTLGDSSTPRTSSLPSDPKEGLYSKQIGSGEPVVLIHGLFGSLENLGAIARALSEANFTVYSLDLPNHGRSAHVSPSTLSVFADIVIQWMNDAGLERAHFFGHSLGGKVVMELALRDPSKVRSLVVVDIAPVHYEPHHKKIFEGLLSIEPEILASRSDADTLLKAYVTEGAVRSFLLKNLVKNPDGGFVWRMNLPIIHRDYAQLIEGNSSGAAFLGKVLFLKGGDSDYIQEAYRDETLRRFPNSQLKVVANTGHWLHAEKPDVVSKLTIAFLRS